MYDEGGANFRREAVRRHSSVSADRSDQLNGLAHLLGSQATGS